MKKFCLFLLFCSTFSYAQFSINGTLTKELESDWVILYKIESTQQVFVANTTIKKDSLLTNGKKVAVGTFLSPSRLQQKVTLTGLHID